MSDPSLVRFRSVVVGGLAHLESRRREINDLNVFPVADGDTGDNMALTLQAVLTELDRLANRRRAASLDEIGRDEIVESVARAALLGARGNSGVILSQLIRGAAEELVSRPGELVDPVLIGAAMARAAQRAYGSVRQPAEGTILTVLRDMATSVSTEIAHMGDTRLGSDGDPAVQNALIADVLERALHAGEASVLRGPDLLPVLRESGVVDAGGHALTVIVAGMIAALRGTDAPVGRGPGAGARELPAARLVDVSLLHELRRHRARPRPARLDRAAGGDRRLGARRRRRRDAEDPRPHRRAGARDGASSTASGRSRTSTSPTCTRRCSRAPTAWRPRSPRPTQQRCGALAVVAGAGLRKLYESLGVLGARRRARRSTPRPTSCSPRSTTCPRARSSSCRTRRTSSWPPSTPPSCRRRSCA